MLRRITGHARQNAVAYIALMVAVVSGGGGYAIAATTHHQTRIVACASKESGELFLHHGGKCAEGRRKVSWSIRGARGKTGAAGAPAPSIFAAVDPSMLIAGLQPAGESGMTVTREGVGSYTITITNSVCAAGGAHNVPTVTPSSYSTGGVTPPAGAAPVAYLGTPDGVQFPVSVGYVGSTGTFVPTDFYFDVQDTCLPRSADRGSLSTR